MHALNDVSVPTAYGFREVPSRQANELLNGVRLIDVREPSEFSDQLGHVHGAELIPLATIPQVAAAWDRNATYLIICRSGGRSSNAAMWMASQGFRSVFNLSGGMMGWNQAGLPVER